ncbi:hypothetical protein A4S06_08100 [Erysipelotrichaceae bacterium MTC7]|nr:hypothetical protein A4S06_08100 [Erysipelotrichaceae bacterium MTC7]
MRKIGLLGGSFDPVHKGHIAMAKHALQQLHVDEVWFVLSEQTPLKDRKLTSYEDRRKMLELAFHKFAKFKVCDIEKGSKQKNYTIDTVKRLKKLHPTTEFYFLLGNDQVDQLDAWKGIDELQHLVQLCAFARNGKASKSPYKWQHLAMDAVAISSSDIRSGKLEHVDADVISYFCTKLLYDDILKTAMSTYRYEHSLSVATLCKELAHAHNLDEDLAYLMGYYHDINKEFKRISVEDSKRILHVLAPDLLKEKESIWHGFMGAYVCKKQLFLKNDTLCEAIAHHVLGNCHSNYAKILYIADKCDPLRDYDSSALIARSKENLHEGFRAVKKDQATYYGEEYNDGK